MWPKLVSARSDRCAPSRETIKLNWLIIISCALLIACSQPTKQTRHPSVRAEFLREHPALSMVNDVGPCPGYVVDHIKPLCVGDDDSVDNMQWQTSGGSYLKDNSERAMCREYNN